MLEENGYPSVDALKAAVSNRTAALLINNPDDMGIYNPDMKEWVRIVHEAGGLCFYDHANFNGVMAKILARDIGFDACMFMLHKTFGAPKGGGGPAVGAYGCTSELAPFLPVPVVVNGVEYYRHLGVFYREENGPLGTSYVVSKSPYIVEPPPLATAQAQPVPVVPTDPAWEALHRTGWKDFPPPVASPRDAFIGPAGPPPGPADAPAPR